MNVAYAFQNDTHAPPHGPPIGKGFAVNGALVMRHLGRDIQARHVIPDAYDAHAAQVDGDIIVVMRVPDDYLEVAPISIRNLNLDLNDVGHHREKHFLLAADTRGFQGADDQTIRLSAGMKEYLLLQ